MAADNDFVLVVEIQNSVIVNPELKDAVFLINQMVSINWDCAWAMRGNPIQVRGDPCSLLFARFKQVNEGSLLSVQSGKDLPSPTSYPANA